MDIERFFSPASTTLYHYTNIGALLGIVDTRSLWASHAYYLNDSQEILYAIDRLRDLVAEMDLGSLTFEESELLKEFPEWLETFRGTYYHVFVFSLSEQRSLLSQWRSYTTHGKGVSLGFEAEVLNDLVKGAGCKLGRCLYDRNEQTELVFHLFAKVWDTFRDRVQYLDVSKRHPSQKYHGFLEEFRGDFLQALAIVKSPQFREEREWRIVSPYFAKYTVPQVKFREGASMLLPYIELQLPPADGPIPIFEEVVLGPSQDANLSASALSSYLSNTRMSNRTGLSGIPFRKW